MPTISDASKKLGGEELSCVVFGEEEIRSRVRQMGREITEAFGAGHDLHVLGLLKGSFIFLADLVRAIDRPLQIDFLVARSYGSRMVSSGDVELLYAPGADLEGRSVVVVEDIVDSGATMARILPVLEERGARSVDVCALLHKRKTSLDPPARWVGFDAPKEFLVGYGLDYSEDFRHLPYIASL